MFSSLQPRKRKWNGPVVVFSVAAHLVLFALVAFAPLRSRERDWNARVIDIVTFVPTPADAPKPPSPPPMEMPKARPEPPKPRVEPKPLPEPPKPPEPKPVEAPRPEPPKPKPEPPKPKPVVKTAGFDAPEPKPAPEPPKPREASTGAFASERVSPVQGHGTPVLASARTGAFAVEAAPSRPGPRDDRTVETAGFGAAPEKEATHRASERRVVAASAFGETQKPRPASAPRSLPAGKPDHPVEILSKPKPAYTEEAQKLHVEGEVELEVVFTADGRIRVLRVVRGLGHGLDEAAVAAASQIRFQPARRDGVPVDHQAVLRVVFQLA